MKLSKSMRSDIEREIVHNEKMLKHCKIRGYKDLADRFRDKLVTLGNFLIE